MMDWRIGGGACLVRNWCNESVDGGFFGKPRPNGTSGGFFFCTLGTAGTGGDGNDGCATLGDGAGGTVGDGATDGGRGWGVDCEGGNGWGVADGGKGSIVLKIVDNSSKALWVLSPSSRPNLALVGAGWRRRVTMSPTAWRRKSLRSTSGTGITCGTKVTVSWSCTTAFLGWNFLTQL